MSPGSRCPLDDALRQGSRPFRNPLQKDDAEFVPADARHRVDLPYGVVQDAGEFLQGDVAGGVLAHFVECRKAVDVEHQQAERSATAATAQDLLIQLVVEVATIVKVGQRVEERVERKGVPRFGAIQVGLGLKRERPEQFRLHGGEWVRDALPEDEDGPDVAVAVQGKSHQGPGGPRFADWPRPSPPVRVHGDGFAKVGGDRPGCDQEGDAVRGRTGLDSSAEADLP
ncbi:MAG: hypothetical protein H6Q83_1748 [Deltaproteobacteria bacterium]|nr:hypothetical protein [Deltaproteobacteria bacterium]